MSSLPQRSSAIVSFGPFTLFPGERLLSRGGVAVNLGTRALDILIALASRPNEIVSKGNLLAEVWPDVIVEEGSLRFHIANLRKALGDGRDGARYIATLTGRGYSFVAPLTRDDRLGGPPPTAHPRLPPTNMPNRPLRMLGRAVDVDALTALLAKHRFVTLVGAGGIGKTTVAVEVGHDLSPSFDGAVLFVDLGMLSDPGLVATAVASMFGLSIFADDVTPGLIAFLRDRRILLILDTCEHLVEAVAMLASRVFSAAPAVHILATSRETLQVAGEQVYRLLPLACPPEKSGDTAAIVEAFPATQFFIERAAARGASIALDDEDAALVADICRKLGGVPLAIELAARRVEAYGLRQIVAHLDQSVALRWAGARGAPERQKTLRDTLEWSYGLLSERERTVLRRLAVFVGDFTLEAALAVVTDEAIDQADLFGAIDSLVAKSMVATRPAGAMMRYRLLDTTRAYAVDIGEADGDRAQLVARHADYYRRWLEQIDTSTRSADGLARADRFAGLNNVRAALEWCFGENGDAKLGLRLAAAAGPVFLAMSLLPECHRWSERAIRALDEAACGGHDDMRLNAALGVSLMFTRGGKEAAQVALERSLAIAVASGDAAHELQALGPLQMFHLRTGGFTTALAHAQRCATLSSQLEDPAAHTMARSLLGISLHFAGEHAAARTELEAALAAGLHPQRTTTVHIGFECRILAGTVLARTLWLQGYPDEADVQARRTLQEAAAADHSLSLCIALIWSISVFLWNGDPQSAAEHIDWLTARAESNSFAPYVAVARAFRAELLVDQGDAPANIAILQASLAELHAAPYEMLTTAFELTLVRALLDSGRLDDAEALLSEAMDAVNSNGDNCYAPELLRLRGRVLLQARPARVAEARRFFTQSLDLASLQGAVSWKGRTLADVARLQNAQGMAG